MAVTTTNLIQGPGTLYTGAFSAVEPADTAVNTVPAASAWTDVGGTQDGVKLKVGQTFSELEVDQIVDIPGRRLTKREFTIETNLAEPTIDNLAIALNDSTVATGSGFKSLEPINTTSATQPTYRALIMDGYSPTSKRRRVIVRKALSSDDIEFAYMKDKQTVYTVNFSGHYVSSSIAPFKIVDEQ